MYLCHKCIAHKPLLRNWNWFIRFDTGLRGKNLPNKNRPVFIWQVRVLAGYHHHSCFHYLVGLAGLHGWPFHTIFLLVYPLLLAMSWSWRALRVARFRTWPPILECCWDFATRGGVAAAACVRSSVAVFSAWGLTAGSRGWGFLWRGHGPSLGRGADDRLVARLRWWLGCKFNQCLVSFIYLLTSGIK